MKNIMCISFDTVRLLEIDADSGRVLTMVASDARSDVAVDPDGKNSGHYAPLVMISPITRRVQAVALEYLTWTWHAVDAVVRADLARLARVSPGFPLVVSRDARDVHWIVEFRRDDAESHVYFYDRSTGCATELAFGTPPLFTARLSRQQPVVIPARDGLRLPSYLTLPKGLKADKLPLVVYAHGGPWDRDDWGFDALVQWLANRGYATVRGLARTPNRYACGNVSLGVRRGPAGRVRGH
jgi:hypothetical protein